MTVTHPAAQKTGTPAAYTYGSTTYPIVDGEVQCPESVADEIASALAERYDVDTTTLYTDGSDGAVSGSGSDTSNESDGEETDSDESDGDTCETVKTDGEVCGRERPCPYHD